jgi:hypothetical protein
MTERPLYSENRLKSLVFGIYSMSSSTQIAPPSLAPPVLFLGASDSSLYRHRSRISAIVARMEEGLELLSDSLLLQPGVRDFLAGLPANSVDLTHLSTPRLLRWLIQSIQLISAHLGEELNRFCLSSLLEEEISVTTLNVWGVPLLLGGRCRERYRHIGRKLNARAADIVCLQEMWDRATRDIIDTPILDKTTARCRAQGALVIFDEVMTGFGRTGPLFASHSVHNQPDLNCLSKGILGGMLPFGATTGG